MSQFNLKVKTETMDGEGFDAHIHPNGYVEIHLNVAVLEGPLALLVDLQEAAGWKFFFPDGLELRTGFHEPSYGVPGPAPNLIDTGPDGTGPGICPGYNSARTAGIMETRRYVVGWTAPKRVVHRLLRNIDHVYGPELPVTQKLLLCYSPRCFHERVRGITGDADEIASSINQHPVYLVEA